MQRYNRFSLRKWMPLCIGTAALLLSAATGCAPMRELPAAATPQLPESFAGVVDTTAMPALSWRQFFTDNNLQQLVDSALRNNWDVLSAYQQVELARASHLYARNRRLPQVQAIASTGADRFGAYTMNGVGNYDLNKSPNIRDDQKIPEPFMPDFFLGVRSAWEIDLWGRLRNLKESASLRLLQSQRGAQWVRTQLVSEVAARYYQLLALDSQREILAKNISLQQAAVTIMEAQKEGGRATELAVQQFRAQVLRTRAMDADLQQQIVALENELNLLCGRTPQAVRRTASLMAQPLPQMVQNGVPSALLLRRPDIQEAELGLRALEADLSAARKAFLPSLTLTPYLGFHSFNAARLFDPTSLAVGVLGALAAPVFNRAAIRADYNRVNAARTDALLQYQKATFSGFTEVVTTLSEIRNLERQYQLREAETQVLESAVGSANDLYLAGYATYIEVITAQRSVVEAELELVANRRNQYLSLISLYRALGGGAQ